MTEAAARAFIRLKIGEYELQGITTTTAKQRFRMEQLDVVPPERKHEAKRMMAMAAQFYGPAPRSGMRTMNMHTGEITQR
jgi:hypothetical protein